MMGNVVVPVYSFLLQQPLIARFYDGQCKSIVHTFIVASLKAAIFQTGVVIVYKCFY